MNTNTTPLTSKGSTKEEVMGELASNTKEMASDAKKTFEQSSADWINYIKDHPFQSMLFGTVLLYSLKGFLKK